MPSLKCTQRLLKAIGVREASGAQAVPSSSSLGDWYANLLVISRKKVLLFTNGSTLYSFAVVGVRKKGLKKIAELFLEHLRLNLDHEGLPAPIADRLIAEYQSMGLARTDNRSVLGSMNDLSVQLECFILDPRRAEGSDILEINKDLNRTPHKPLRWKYSIELLRERLLGVFSLPPSVSPPAKNVFLN